MSTNLTSLNPNIKPPHGISSDTPHPLAAQNIARARGGERTPEEKAFLDTMEELLAGGLSRDGLMECLPHHLFNETDYAEAYGFKSGDIVWDIGAGSEDLNLKFRRNLRHAWGKIEYSDRELWERCTTDDPGILQEIDELEDKAKRSPPEQKEKIRREIEKYRRDFLQTERKLFLYLYDETKPRLNANYLERLFSVLNFTENPGAAIIRLADATRRLAAKELEKEKEARIIDLAARKARCKLMSGAAAGELPDYKLIVQDMLFGSSVAVMFGEPGVGKSFCALDLSLHIAAGRRWHGMEVEQGKVLYCFGEGISGLKRRLNAAKKHYGTPIPDDIVIMASVPNLTTNEGVEDLIEAARASGARVIVIDTLSKALAGADENGSGMTAAIAGARKVIAETGTAVLLIHHSGKDASRGPRGHSSLTGDADSEFVVTRDRGKVVTVRSLKQRDTDTDVVLRYRLKKIELGTDQWGKPFSSCAVEPIGAAKTTSGGGEKVTKIAPSLRDALDTLRNLGGGEHPVAMSEWQDAHDEVLERKGVVKPNSKRAMFSKAVKGLTDAGAVLIGETDDTVTISAAAPPPGPTGSDKASAA